MNQQKYRLPGIGIAVLLVFLLTWGCGPFRSEWYRGETAHLLDKGDTLYRSGEYADARTCYSEALRLDPNGARGHAALGNIAYVEAEFEEAAACYERAMALEPDLEKVLTPLYLEALRLDERRELEACGVDPGRVMELLLAGREEEVEVLIHNDISVAGLARQAGCLSLQEQDRLLDLAEERARSGGVSTMCALFYGHLLAVHDDRAFPAARLLRSAARTVEGPERQKAYMTLGAIYIRLGRETDAAGAYERALAAGCPRDEVIPLLAALYGVPAGVMAEGEEHIEASMKAGEKPRSLSSGGEISGSLQPPDTIEGGAVSGFHRVGPQQDRDVLVRPVEKVKKQAAF